MVSGNGWNLVFYPRGEFVERSKEEREMSSVHVFFLFFLSSTIFSTVSAADISLGSALLAADPNSKWTSPSGTFSFTFFLDPSGASSAYFAAIIYDSNPDVAIWVAGATSSSGGAADSTASLRLLPNGNLELRNGSSNSLVWQSSTSARVISAAALEDSGNFVLKNGTVSNIWSTFDNPTDTIVPSQNFTVNTGLRNGIYSFNLATNGNLTLRWNDTITYYNSDLSSSAARNLSSPILSILSTGVITLSDSQHSSSLNLAYSSDYAEGGDILRFVKLDNDGNLRIYSSTKGSRSKGVKWSAVTDQCLVFGYCGNMGMCSYNDTGPVCGCPSQNFEPVDPKDSRQGCKRKVDLSNCEGNGTMLVLDHTLLLTYPPETTGGNSQIFSTGFQACRSNCLLTNPCQGSTSLVDGTGFCYVKTSPFISGYQSAVIPSSSFLKICGQAMTNLPPPPLPSPNSRRQGKSRKVAMAIALSIVSSVVLFIISFVFLKRRSIKKHPAKIPDAVDTDDRMIDPESLQYSLRVIELATNKFSVDNKIGQGGFGSVYKGKLPNGQDIAVKRLSKSSSQGVAEFKNEIGVVAKLQHNNLVRLLGFCLEGEEKILVFEFVPNRSLDYFLFDSDKKGLLNWSRRRNIVAGIARGLLYLHEDSRLKIVHRDLKAGNILLDEDMQPKIADFGMAKICRIDQSEGNTTKIAGTFGYMAPEYTRSGQYSIKSDVFSFGVVLLEIITGKKNSAFYQSEDSEDLLSYVWQHWRDDTPLAVLDQAIGDSYVQNEVIQCLHVGLLCVEEDANKRPTMASLVYMLNSTSISLPAPRRPATRRHQISENTERDSGSDHANNKLAPASANIVSITEPYPR